MAQYQIWSYEKPEGKYLHKNVISRLLLPGQSVKLSFIRLEKDHDKKSSEVLILSNLNTSFFPDPKQL